MNTAAPFLFLPLLQRMLASVLRQYRVGFVIRSYSEAIACPNFDTLPLTSSFQFSHTVECRCCRDATKIINHHLKAETISKLTIYNRCRTIFYVPKLIFCKLRSQRELSDFRAHYPRDHYSFHSHFNVLGSIIDLNNVL